MGCGASTAAAAAEEEAAAPGQPAAQEKEAKVKPTAQEKEVKVKPAAQEKEAAAQGESAAQEKEAAAPAGQASAASTAYNLSKSTAENYGTSEMAFMGPYARIREGLDYQYHTNYTPERQETQDRIIATSLSTQVIDTETEKVSSRPRRPWIVFTAGAMGAGMLLSTTH